MSDSMEHQLGLLALTMASASGQESTVDEVQSLADNQDAKGLLRFIVHNADLLLHQFVETEEEGKEGGEPMDLGPDQQLLFAAVMHISSMPSAWLDELLPVFLNHLQPAADDGIIVDTLLSLFHSLAPTSAHRFSVFKVLITIPHVLSAFLPQLEDNLDQWLVQWQLSQKQTRDLYHELATLLETSGQTALSQAYMTKYIKSLNGAAASDLAAAKADATSLLAKALSTDAADAFTLLRTDAVKQLSDTPIYKVVDALTKGDLAAYKAIIAANSGIYNELNVDAAAVERRVQLMSVAAFCSNKTQVTFAELAAGLGVSEEEAEDLVVDATCQSLMEATIDQMQRVISVTRVVNQQFVQDDWALLEKQLQAWAANIQQVETTLQTVHKKINPPRLGGKMKK
eukprot:m.20284 g.20284  ORF g.20284 m.20284 type:complete len:399 (+) comp8849_c0_seq1:318-1514(+)